MNRNEQIKFCLAFMIVIGTLIALFILPYIKAEIPQVIIEKPSLPTTQTIIINGSATGNCPDGYAVQNVTATSIQCILMPNVSSSDTWLYNYTNYYTISQVDNNILNNVSLKTNFSSFNSTQMSYSGGYINILVSWLNSLFYSITNPNNYISFSNLSNYGNNNINGTAPITTTTNISSVINICKEGTVNLNLNHTIQCNSTGTYIIG